MLPMFPRCLARLTLGFALSAAVVCAETLDRNFNPNPGDIVYALATYPGGRTLVGGAFARLGGVTRPWLGRLNANGTLDATFQPVLNGVVQCIVVQPDGKILIGGQFGTVNAVNRNRIARLNADGGLDLTFNPGSAATTTTSQGPIVRCIVLQPDGKILVGGNFEAFNGLSRHAVARLNADGSLDPGFDPDAREYLTDLHSRGAFSLALQADGKVLFGGQFLRVGGQPRNGLARVNADGSLDPTFTPATAQTSYNAIVVQADGRIVVGGGFSVLGGFAQRSLVRLNPDGSPDRDFALSLDGSLVSLFLQADGRILLSGFFTSVSGQPRAGFARVTANGAVDSSFITDLTYPGTTHGPVSAVVTQADGTTMVGGTFTSIAGAAFSNLARFQVPVPSRLRNLSTRAFIPADDVLSVGMAARGGPKSLMLRAVGPALTNFGLTGALADPQIYELRPGATVPETSNDDWSSSAGVTAIFNLVGAFPLPPFSRDAVAFTTLVNGSTTAWVSSAVSGGSGIVLAEAYDRDVAEAGQLINLSTLGFAGSGAQSLAAGFVIGGETVKTLLVRAVGPGLTPFGVTGVMADPQLTIVPQGSASSIASNDNWGGDATVSNAAAAAGAFPLITGTRDAAIVVRLAPGAYTVNVSGVANTTGRALVEIYDLDP